MIQASIIGSGVAGMAAAIRLALKGWEVTVFEQAEKPGGKLGELRFGGYRFDAGPSLFTWPELILELDELVRQKATDLAEFQFEKLDRSAHYFWMNGMDWIAWSDREQRRKSVDDLWGAGAGDALESYLNDSSIAFEATRPLFLESSLHESTTYGWKNVEHIGKQMHKLPLLGTFHQRNSRYRLPSELVQFLDRYATYNGSDPHRAPAMLQVIPHLEHGMGTYFPKGGMIGIAQHLHAMAEAAGVRFKFKSRVESIEYESSEVIGLKVNGDFHPSNIVVSNSDVYPTYRHLLPQLKAPEKTLKRERSTSGLIFYWGIKKTHRSLHLHNLFFSENYRDEFARIGKNGHPGDDLTAYVNITSKCSPEDAPEGSENWFVLINVAADPDGMTEERVNFLRKAIIKRVDQALMKSGELRAGESLADSIEFERRLTPQDIETNTSSWRGALYGTSSNSAAAAFLRHRNRSKDLKGLFFCGGSVHPGGGIPLCLLSGKIVSELVPDLEKPSA